ncbi:MAG: class I SAM-dependent methyltransferase [Rhodoferax sp.]|uniref:class I SAM-dependent methyltransferase n=1 Tax=Rhodoferax sp. TaxID=50421 RepID=UPI0032642829
MNSTTQTARMASPLAESWPEQDMETLGQCPVCNSQERTPLHGALTDRLFNCAPGNWQLHTCTACQVAYLDPRPTQASIGRAYSTYFTHTEVSAAACSAPKTPSRQERLRQWIQSGLNDYRNARWQMHLTPASSWGRLVVPLAWPLRNLLTAHMRHLPPHPPYPGARLLDVGCGSGAFLEMAQAAGWQVQGVDFDPQAVASACSRGLNVICGGLEQVTDPAAGFDYLTCSHVIEHVHDPRQWLDGMHSLLRPHGKLWLQTPNIASKGHVYFGGNWRGLEPPRHLILFTPEKLTTLLEDVGFAVRLLPLPMLMAVPVYDASRNLANGRAHTEGVAWRSLLHMPSLWNAFMQSIRTNKAEFITVEATRTR